jgi:N4-gp56 family major capsid protein
VGSTGLLATGPNVDVYPVIVAAEDAWAQVALRGQNAMDVSYIAPGQKDKNDPLGQRGYIGAKFWFTTKITNPGWMAVAWVGTPSLA